MKIRSTRAGFTLIEVSIVLVIIGLIVGGILVGRDMIRQAEFRSLITDVERYKSTVNAFRLKYNCLAGDCINATDFFPVRADGCPYGVGKGVCNGDGDGNISPPNTSTAEYLWVWQHLSLAQMVGGNFTGVGDGLASVTFGLNTPESRIQGVGYTIAYVNFTGSSNPGYIINGSSNITDNRIAIGTPTPFAGSIGAFISATEAYSLDSKYDDGNPGTGAITVNPGAGCAYTLPPATGGYYYALNGTLSDNRVCNLVYDLQF